MAAAGLTVDIEERLKVDFAVDLLFDEEPTPRQIVNLLWQKLGGAPLEPPQPPREEATVVATPLTTLLVLEDGPIKTIADLKGKKVGFSVGGFEDALLGEIERLQPAETLISENLSLVPAMRSRGGLRRLRGCPC